MRPRRRQPIRLPHPWDSSGKNTGVGCHFLLQCMKVKSESEVAQLYPTLSDPMDCSLPGSSIHGIFQASVFIETHTSKERIGRFSMTSAFSWQNSISLCPASFHIPRPNLLLLQCFLTFYFCIPVPYNEKDIFFWVLVLKGLVGLHRTI